MHKVVIAGALVVLVATAGGLALGGGAPRTIDAPRRESHRPV